jgi:hypothetical protein
MQQQHQQRNSNTATTATSKQAGAKKEALRRRGIEPRATEWESAMLPLHHHRIEQHDIESDGFHQKRIAKSGQGPSKNTTSFMSTFLGN